MSAIKPPFFQWLASSSPAERVHTTAIKMVARRWSQIVPTDWDTFAARAGGSFRECWSIVRLNAFRGRLRIFEFEDALGEKVGQCAILIRRGRATFLDRLHIRPERADYKHECLALIFGELGSLNYEYGSLWNQEMGWSPEIAGFTVRPILETKFQVDFIDISHWKSFSNYRRAVSESIRSDFNRASGCGLVRIEMARGLGALRLVPQLARSRRVVARKNGHKYIHARNWLFDLILNMSKLVALGDRAFIALARNDREVLATFLGVEFGGRLYYLTGGTTPNRTGAGSYLILTLIENWFDREPDGQFVFGHFTGVRDPSTYQDGAALYRRKLRVVATEGLNFSFAVETTTVDRLR